MILRMMTMMTMMNSEAERAEWEVEEEDSLHPRLRPLVVVVVVEVFFLRRVMLRHSLRPRMVL